MKTYTVKLKYYSLTTIKQSYSENKLPVGFDLNVVDGSDGGPKGCQCDGKDRTLEETTDIIISRYKACVADETQPRVKSLCEAAPNSLLCILNLVPGYEYAS